MNTGGQTSDGKIADEFIRVRGIQQLSKVDIDKLASNHGRHVEGLVLVEGAAQLQGLTVVGSELRKGLVGGGDGRPIVAEGLGLEGNRLADGGSLHGRGGVLGLGGGGHDDCVLLLIWILITLDSDVLAMIRQVLQE